MIPIITTAAIISPELESSSSKEREDPDVFSSKEREDSDESIFTVTSTLTSTVSVVVTWLIFLQERNWSHLYDSALTLEHVTENDKSSVSFKVSMLDAAVGVNLKLIWLRDMPANSRLK